MSDQEDLERVWIIVIVGIVLWLVVGNCYKPESPLMEGVNIETIGSPDSTSTAH